MNQRQADLLVTALVAVVLLGGGALTWQAYQQRRAVDRMMGSMMGSSTGPMHGTDPLWYVFGTLAVVVVVSGGYLLVREDLSSTEAGRPAESADAGAEYAASVDPPTQSSPERPDGESPTAQSETPEANPRERVLDLLPDDERRVLAPVLDSPGITQIELRDRSDFSKSKVSQTVSELEKRGLLYREKQGRTYRIFPSEDLRDRPES